MTLPCRLHPARLAWRHTPAPLLPDSTPREGTQGSALYGGFRSPLSHMEAGYAGLCACLCLSPRPRLRRTPPPLHRGWESGNESPSPPPPAEKEGMAGFHERPLLTLSLEGPQGPGHPQRARLFLGVSTGPPTPVPMPNICTPLL